MSAEREEYLKAFKHYTVVFVGDASKPENIIMLVRSQDRYGGGYATGIGGKFEPEVDSSMLAAAKRELYEEVEPWSGLDLNHFATVQVNGKALHYFFAVKSDIDAANLPEVGGDEGKLIKVTLDEMFAQNVFPTTLALLEVWRDRDFDVSKPFTVILDGRLDENNVTCDVKVVSVSEGVPTI